MSDTILFEQLDELVEDCAGALGDWDDVLRRARIRAMPGASRRRPRRPSRRVLAWAAVAAALLVILFATPAFGLLQNWVGRKDVPFSGRPSPRVTKEFASLSRMAPRGLPKALKPRPFTSQARLVTVFHGFGQKFMLYVMPTKGGGFCRAYSDGRGEFGSCFPTHSSWRPNVSPGEVSPRVLEASYGMRRPNVASSHFEVWVDGVVFSSKVAMISVEYEDRSAVEVPFVFVTKPINAGFFFYPRPPGHRAVGKRLAFVVARDSHGKLLARVSLGGRAS